jgi:hypothetical protein
VAETRRRGASGSESVHPIRLVNGHTSCSFTLGFAALHDELPMQVGDCAADVQVDPQAGDALQATTNGLLTWQKVDNLTTFTDGTQTWIDGPFGLETRPSMQRFWWEPNPEGLAIIPPAQPGDRCHTAGTRLSLVGSDQGAGNVVGTFALTSTLDVSCTLFGYIGAELRDSADNPLPTVVVRGGGRFTSEPGPMLITVPAHGSAHFLVHWTQIPVGDENTCPVAASLAVIVPDDYVPLNVPVTLRPCGGGRLDLSAIRAPVSMPAAALEAPTMSRALVGTS